MKKHFLNMLLCTGMATFGLMVKAHATEQSGEPPPHFFPLQAARGNAPVKVKSLSEANARVIRPLRSDADAMRNGGFRLDRERATSHDASPLIVYPSQETASDLPKVTRGGSTPKNDSSGEQSVATATAAVAATTAANADPVLDLFNTNDSASLPSFRDALTGHITTGASSAAPLGAQHRWPLATASSRVISSNYGYRNDPINQKMEFHNGIDISAPMGTPVIASADGDVTNVGEDAFFGKSITLRHGDGTETLYGHLSAQAVAVGQQVKAGQKIGAVGMSGRVTGAHLHYTVKRDGVTLDPMKLLSGSPAVATAAIDNPSHVYPGSPMVTRPRAPSRSEKLIIVR